MGCARGQICARFMENIANDLPSSLCCIRGTEFSLALFRLAAVTCGIGRPPFCPSLLPRVTYPCSNKVPNTSNFNYFRMTVLFLVALLATSEYYEYCSNPACNRLGQNAWLIFAIMQVQ